MKTTQISLSRVAFLLLLACQLQTASGETVSGYVDYAALYQLNVGVSGEVKSVSVREGNRVTKGTLLLELDDTVLIAAVNAATARSKFLLADMEERQRAHDRDSNLFAEGSLSSVELDLSRLALLEAAAKYSTSKAELAGHQSRLNLSRISAPISGLVLRRNANPGERIVIENRSLPAFIMASDEKVVRAEIKSTPAVLLNLGQNVELESDGGRGQGKIEAIEFSSTHGWIKTTISTRQSLPDVGHPVKIIYQ